MMQTFEEVLREAIRKEADAAAFYRMASQRVESGISKTFQDMAVEEEKHKRMNMALYKGSLFSGEGLTQKTAQAEDNAAFGSNMLKAEAMIDWHKKILSEDLKMVYIAADYARLHGNKYDTWPEYGTLRKKQRVIESELQQRKSKVLEHALHRGKD